MTNNSYWFFLEPYVYVSIKADKVLLYNTFDANSIISDDKEVCELVRGIYAPENGGVVSISSDQLDSGTKIRKFVDHVREYFMGDVVETSISNRKPTQLLPILNLQAELLQRESEDYIGDGIATNLRSLVVYTNGGDLHNDENVANYFKQISVPCSGYDNIQIPVELLLSFLRRSGAVGAASVQLMGGNIFKYDGFDVLMENLSDLNMKSTIGARYQDVDEKTISKITADNVSLTVFADFPLDMSRFDSMLDILNDSFLPFKLSFNVAGIGDVGMVESIIADRKITEYEMLPVYTGNNDVFFRDTIFLNTEDILDEPISMKKLFANQVVNSIFWGILTVTPDGKVYANVNMPSIGKIDDSISEILFEEITKGSTWKMIRDKKPCSECVYQWLCPSPSNYELVIGKPNLCTLKP